MNSRKTSKSDLESKRSMFLQIGLVVSLTAALIAFEWSSSDVSYNYAWYGAETEATEELVPITVHKEITPPPKAPQPLNLLEIVYTDEPLEETLYLGSSEYTDEIIFVEWKPTEDPREVLPFAEIMPTYPGGEQALFRFLAENIQYPRTALRNDIQGKVFVSFVVDRNGKVTDIKVVRGQHHELDNEAIRVIKLMPDWEPGIQNGERVNVAFTVPVNFEIRNW
ncbi:energy transducer TonB [Natronoflexus pectinivorans]|uniref:Protein TonB n=1 Tax=Natronoflexus pectinivorans TaxID=682526 RepID=A0A4R2GJ71_9BACT|nr:energy transducer TonB [Natronoflexus pectinivorans]TCO08362.1 protein TonB [Natronoflexus pectinivorans]